jgi:alkaline phosphatase
MAKQNTTSVDGFVLVVPKKQVAEYRKMAAEGAKIWMKHGALSYRECMLDDAKPEFVTLTFPIMVKAKANETVWFSYIEYKSKAHRNQVNKKVMKEMDEKYKDEAKDMNAMPFDMKRMAYGGFKVVVGT